MPFMKKRLPALERLRSDSGTRTMMETIEDYLDEHDDSMHETDDEYLSDGSMQSEPSLRKMTIPTIPPRSRLRISRNLESMNDKLEHVNMALLAQTSSEKNAESDPYESYVSSEEDGSISADDIDDSRIELDRESSTSQASSQCSHEDIARAVSFMSVGKPHLVEIFPQARPNRALDHIRQTRPRPSAIRLPRDLSRSSSLSTRISSLSQSSTMSEHRDHRATSSSFISSDNTSVSSHSVKDSIDNSAATSNVSSTVSHSFLQTDPFPTVERQEVEQVLFSTNAPETPVSPTTTSWKDGFKGVSRSLSLKAKKRPSMPMLSLASNFGSTKHTLHAPSPATPVLPEMSPATSFPLKRPSPDQSPVTYQDIMKTVIKAPPPTSATPDTSKKTKIGVSLLGLGRKKSMKNVAQYMSG